MVTAVSWLASGDSDGRVIVWDIATATTVLVLEDPLAAAQSGTKGKGGAVRGLAWVCAHPTRLGIVLANGMFLVWDVQGTAQSCNAQLWRKDFGAEAALASVRVDPGDARRLVLCGQRGSLIVLKLNNMARDRVEQQQYKVDMSASKAGDSLRASFSTTRDLLYVVVFDLEYGQPAASTTLPTSRPPFRDVLGCFGHADVGKGLAESGVDLLYTSHQDGSISIWRRTEGQLTYSLLGLHKLVPPPSRVNNNSTLSLLCAAAAAWWRCDIDANRDGSSAGSSVFEPMDSMPRNSLTAKAAALMSRGRKLSTIYSRVSPFSSSVNSEKEALGDSGEVPSWQKHTQGQRSSGGPNLQQPTPEVAASASAPSSGAERNGNSSADKQQSGAEQGPEMNGGSLSAYAREDRSSEEEADFLRPSISGRSSDSSLGRIFTAQSSLDPVPETSEAAPVALERTLSPLTSYPVRLSPAASSTGGGYGGISPRSSLLSLPSDGDQGPPGAGGDNPPTVYGSPGRSPMIRRQSSLKPPRPPGSALKSPSPAKSLTFSTAPPETCSGPTSLCDDSTPRAPTSVFSNTIANQPSSSVSAPRNAFEERLLSGGFASASSPGQSTFRASPAPPPQSGFEQRMPSFANLPIDQTASPFDRGVAPSQLRQSLSLGDLANGGGGLSLYTAAIPTLDVPPPSESLLVMAVSEEGYVWQWDVPLQELFEDDKAAPAFPSAPTMLPTAFSIAVPSKTANAAAPAATGSTKPRLLGLLQTLPHSVTTFSVCPVAVGVGMLGMPGGPPSASSGRGGDAVAVLAAVTAAGNVEFVTLQRGSVSPLMGTVSVSLGAHKDVVRGVRWLGPSARVVSFSSEKTQHGYRNTLLITDVRSRASLPFREVGPEAAPMLGIRASPSGRYLLILLRGAPSEIWALGGNTKPTRIRVLDLPFTAVEWVLPGDLTSWHSAGSDSWMVWERSPLARERSLMGYWDEANDAQIAAAAHGATHEPSAGDAGAHPGHEGAHAASAAPNDINGPEERLAFALSDGRVGVLAVKGRKVTDTKPKRPSWGLMSSSSEGVATAIAAWGHLVIMGDTEGSLNRWDTQTGRISAVQTTQGPVRRIHFAPPAAEELTRGSSNVSSLGNARVSVLFANGTFGIWELDARNDLKPGAVSVAASARLGKVIDLAWVPLPSPIGGGSVVVVAGEDGSLACVDATQTVEQRSPKRRLAAFKNLVGGRWPFPQGGLSPQSALGSSLLLPRPWAALLRLLLQQKVPVRTLRKLAGPVVPEEEASLEDVIWACLPKIAKDIWLQSPHRMYSAEAEELSLLAGGRDIHRSGSDELGIAQFASAMSVPQNGVWSARFNTFPMAASLPVTAPQPIRTSDGSSAEPWSITQIDATKSKKATSLKDRIRAGALAKTVGWGAKAEEPVPAPAAAAAAPEESEQQPLAPQKQYAANIGSVVRALTRSRANGQLLHEPEWQAYEEAIASGSTAARMAVVAAVAGSQEEARFWRGLPATLSLLKSMLPPALKARLNSMPPQPSALENGILSAFGNGSLPLAASIDASPFAAKLSTMRDGGSGSGGGPELTSRSTSLRAYGAIKQAEEPTDLAQSVLWSPAKELAEARERMTWHELMSRRNIENSEILQERRVIEYVAVGDFQTAVGFLLASTPERSIRYYRDALCTLALAAASSQPHVAVAAGNHETVSRTLHIQAAKVVAAHAASIGDALLGVPLLCSAGLPQEGVAALQEAGLWRYAATLTAHTLKGDERSAALDRWAAHVHQTEGNVWQALGIMVAGGALRNAALLLRELRMPDAAAAFCAACKEAGFHSPLAPSDAGGLENLFHHTGNTPPRRSSSLDGDIMKGQPEANTVEADYLDYCCSVLQHL
ncbi:probable WD repeat-containing protein 11 at C-terminar half [Coccomyxa sp. Obi]|nr:probable WD repeat-containing protein 11 at C-terminar half [Coccomyxa sp. Obi]